MAVKVKICGVRTPAIIETAAAEGADYVGLVLFERSPRHVEVEEARVLAAVARGKIGTVAVLVDPDDALVDAIAQRVRPDLIQLHGSETPERVATIKARTGLPIMKAIPVAEAADVEQAKAYASVADIILFDAKAAPDATRPGGFGERFDWTLIRAAKAPFALSGGLTPETVGEAVSLTAASLVDVSSGVEGEAGAKDARLVRSFIQTAKAAASAPRAKAS